MHLKKPTRFKWIQFQNNNSDLIFHKFNISKQKELIDLNIERKSTKLKSARNKRWDEYEPCLIVGILDRRWKKRGDRRKIERRWLFPSGSASLRPFYLELLCERRLLPVIYFPFLLFLYLLNSPNNSVELNGYPNITSLLFRHWPNPLTVYTWH